MVSVGLINWVQVVFLGRFRFLAKNVQKLLLATSDVVTIIFASFLEIFLLQTCKIEPSLAVVFPANYIAFFLLVPVIFIALSMVAGVYHSFDRSGKHDQTRLSMTIWLTTVFLVCLAFYFLKNVNEFSPIDIILFSTLGFLAISASRILCSKIFNNFMLKTFSQERVLFIKIQGVSSEQLQSPPFLGYVAHELHDGPPAVFFINLDIEKVPKFASNLPRINRLIDKHYINKVLVKIQQSQGHRFSEIALAMRLLPVPVFIISHPIPAAVSSRRLTRFGNLNVIEIQRDPLSFAEGLSKRVFDITASIFGIIIFAPLMLAIACFIRLESSGPVFFVQQRRGFKGKPFKILKFRSMKVMEDGPLVKQATSRDVRVTRVGRFIRRTSIDELPQLWNVLIGDMSIVGPRPQPVAMDDHYTKLIANYALRHDVKPGVTGLSQTSGLRGETPRIEDMMQRVETDVSYINNWNFWTDLVIIVKTVLVVVRQTQAY